VAAAYIARQRPTLLYLAGPPSYMERDVGGAAIERGIDHLMRLVDTLGCRVIMDHHALRDVHWSERFARLWETGRVRTAAAHLGVEVAALETRRAELWGRVRKPAAASGRAIMTRWSSSGSSSQSTTRRLAKGGTP
jgi:predicted metallo-beta-lactamase superfamily hydrolase